MGLRPEVVQGSLRFSLCYHNSDEEVDRAIQILESVVRRLRKLSRRAFA